MNLFRLSVCLFVTLVWCGFAFCGEIHDAAGKGGLDKVKALLKVNPDLVFDKDEDGASPLHYVAFPNNRFLANIDVTGLTNANTHRREIAELLVKNKADRREIAELLVKNKADINAKNRRDETPLFIAAGKGDQDIVKLLLHVRV
jgi:ankyrin repeat protein